MAFCFTAAAICFFFSSFPFLISAAIEATSDGKTFRGDLYQQEYHFLLRARDGKITEWKEYMDTDLARRVLVGE